MDFRTIIEIIGALASIFAILGGLFVANRYFQRIWRHSGKYMNEYTRHTFFYPLSFAAKILQKNVFEPLGESQFINYAAALSKDFYSNDVAQVKLKIGKNIKELDLPYKEIIDYIAHPDARTMIKGGKIESRFDLGERYMALTQPNFDEFLRERPKTTNGPALRLKSLTATGDRTYECVLQRAGYHDQVRTNLTLDLPIGLGMSMRTEDLSASKQLRPLEESVLANTIGVSAIWVTPCRKGDKKSRHQVFLRPRRKQTGVYYDMLGTVSGVVEVPDDDTFTCETLEEYASSEIIREFYQETGYKQYLDSKSLPETVVQVVPLMFVRELIRGGKPQFFFLIVTPEISESELTPFFNNSYNGTEEFRSNIDARMINYRLSPETQTNLIYALRYIQRFQHLDFVDLND